MLQDLTVSWTFLYYVRYNQYTSEVDNFVANSGELSEENVFEIWAVFEGSRSGMQLEFSRVTSFLVVHWGSLKIQIRGLSEEREVHAQVEPSSLLGHPMINSSSFEMSHSARNFLPFTSPNFCDNNAYIFCGY